VHLVWLRSKAEDATATTARTALGLGWADDLSAETGPPLERVDGCLCRHN